MLLRIATFVEFFQGSISLRSDHKHRRHCVILKQRTWKQSLFVLSGKRFKCFLKLKRRTYIFKYLTNFNLVVFLISLFPLLQWISGEYKAKQKKVFNLENRLKESITPHIDRRHLIYSSVLTVMIVIYKGASGSKFWRYSIGCRSQISSRSSNQPRQLESNAASLEASSSFLKLLQNCFKVLEVAARA